MTDFVFPTGSLTGTQPTATRTSNVLLSDGTNIGSSSVSSILGLVTPEDITRPQFLIGYWTDPNNTTFNVAPGNRNTFSPIGNAVSTNVALNVYANTQYVKSGTGNVKIDGRIYGLISGFDNLDVSGNTTTAGATDRVAIYAGINSASQGGSGWALNTVNYINSDYGGGSSSAGLKSQVGYECDVHNLNRDCSTDFNNPSIGVRVTGTSNYTSTMAILVAGSGNNSNSNSQWNRGIYFASGNVIHDCAIEDQSNSNVSFRISNGLVKGGGAATRNMGIDMTSATFSAGSIGMKKGPTTNGFFWTDGSTASIDSCDTSGNRFVGNGAAAVFVGGGGLYPMADNTTALGASSNRWTTIYAVNGTVQTSDLADKENVEVLPAMLDVVKDLDPIRFNWKFDQTTTHYGFAAQHVKEVIEKHGLEEFGGHVTTPHGDGIRPDQLLPLLWSAVQALAKKVEALEGRT